MGAIPQQLPNREPEPFTDAQRSVLYAIRRRGEATTEQLAEALGITMSGARQHVAALAEAGLVVAHDSTAGRRPPRSAPQVHHLTERAESLFPKAYGELTNQILGYLEPEAVTQVFIRRRDDRIAAGQARLAKRGASPPEFASWPPSSTRTATSPTSSSSTPAASA